MFRKSRRSEEVNDAGWMEYPSSAPTQGHCPRACTQPPKVRIKATLTDKTLKRQNITDKNLERSGRFEDALDPRLNSRQQCSLFSILSVIMVVTRTYYSYRRLKYVE